MKYQQVNLETDVLVVGCGLGGARAALRARELGASVILVEKTVVARGGTMTYVHTQFAPYKFVENDELDEWIEEVVIGANYLADQDACATLIQDGYYRSQELLEMGVPFTRDKDGRPEYFVMRGAKVGTCMAADGRACMEILRRHMIQKGVQLVEKVQIIELLTSDGKSPTKGAVVGAVGIHVQTGAPYVFRAKQVVLNTGPIYPRMRYGFINQCTGEGIAMAYRAGAALTGMEFLQLCAWSIVNKQNDRNRHFTIVGQAKLQKAGHFINSLGEQFMGRYDPVWGEQSGLVQVVRGIVMENLEGRGPCYLDLRHCSEETLGHIYQVVPSVGRAFQEFDVNPRADLLELNPVIFIGSNSSGGIHVAIEDASTTVEGLYATGMCTSSPHMMSGIGMLMATWSNVGGYRAGKAAAERALKMAHSKIDDSQASQSLCEFFKSVKKMCQVRPIDIWNEIYRVTTAAPFALFKTERRISETRDKLREIRETVIEQVYAPDVHEMVKAWEVKNYIQVAELACEAMMIRKESRGELFRTDFPYEDNDNWLKWVMIQRRDGTDEAMITSRELPFDRWPIKPPAGKRPINYPVPERFQ